MNFLDLLKRKDDEVLTGVYYEKRPIIEGYDGALKTDYSTNGEIFKYDILNLNSTNYENIVGGLRADRTTQVIKTDAELDFKIDGYVKTQEGGFYQIVELTKHVAPVETKQALRWFKTSVKTVKTLRLIEVDNPFEL